MHHKFRRISLKFACEKGLMLPAMCLQHTSVAFGPFRSALLAIFTCFVMHVG
jgi:hypothetical protein